jgi:hypothetical protein
VPFLAGRRRRLRALGAARGGTAECSTTVPTTRPRYSSASWCDEAAVRGVVDSGQRAPWLRSGVSWRGSTGAWVGGVAAGKGDGERGGQLGLK